MAKLLLTARDSVAMHFVLLTAFAFVLNREGNRVPGGNEQVYLLYLVKAWHARFLASDWTFQEPTAGHPVFNMVFGWPTLFMPVEALGWVGRLASWALILIALMRIGRHFRIPSWMVSAGILLWLIQRQSFVANEWVIGTFEAKCAAYACLFWAINLLLGGRVVVPAILTGLAFTFHSAVGLWGGAAVALAFISLNPIRTSLKFTAWSVLASLPGVVAALKLVLGGHAISPEEAHYLVVSEMPFHLDPLTFGAAKITVLYMMLLFNWLQARGEGSNAKCGMVHVGSALRTVLSAREEMVRSADPTELNDDDGFGSRDRFPVGSALRTVLPAREEMVRSADPTRSDLSRPKEDPHPNPLPEYRERGQETEPREPQPSFLVRFQLVSGLFFAAGIAFRLLGKFALVELFPFRVFAVTVMLFFFWHLAAAYWHRRQCRPGAAMVALGFLTFLCLPSPVARLQGLAADLLPKWRRGDDDFRTAAKWVRDHAPPDAVVIAPPWRKDAFYFAQHPLVADWHAPRYNAMSEWRQRIEALVGDVSHMDVQENLAGEMDQAARDHYSNLTPAELSAIARQYGGNLLITEGRYGYPALFRSGSYTVYQLDSDGAGQPLGTASVGP